MINENLKKEISTKIFTQKIINYCYFLYNKRGIIYQIENYDMLHDILLIQCQYENIVLDNDLLYDIFCQKVEQVDLEKLNRDIVTLLN